MRAYLVQCPIICQIVEVWRSLDWVPAHRGRVSRRTRMQHCGKMASAAQTRLQTDASWRDVHRGSAAVTAYVLMITMHSVVPAGQLPYAQTGANGQEGGTVISAHSSAAAQRNHARRMMSA